MERFRPFYLAGQTGSGKSAVAVELASRLGRAVIINADAFQIYRGIEILSAAPSAWDRGDIPHLLYGILPIGETCDAARFAALARTEIERQAEVAVPIVVGGSGLYLKGVTHGLGPTPPGDAEIRRQLEALCLDELVARYRALDPAGAVRTNLKNRRYVSRNLEICLITGRPASELKTSWERPSPDIRAVYLERAREDIYERIERRTVQMFDAGVVAEVAAIAQEPSATAAKAIGLREIRALLRGEIDEESCVAAIQQATRRFAKRQETWFRREHQFHRVGCGPADSAATIVNRILDIFPIADLLTPQQIDLCPKFSPDNPPESP